MSLAEFAPGKEVLAPRGMWSSNAKRRKGNPKRANFSQNTRISPGVVYSRPGTSAVAGLSSTGKVTAMYNWVTPNLTNLLLYQDGVTVKQFNQATAVTASVVTLPSTTRAASFADYDIWNYFCGYDVNSNGTGQVQILNQSGAVSTAFAAPVTLTAATATNGGAGQSTIGTHYLGVVYQDNTGFTGKPSTTVSGTPIAITLATDSRLINLSVTLPALANGGGNATMYLVMTPADNLAEWFFIPTDAQTGSIGSLPVPLNTVTTLNFVASLSDSDIQASAQSALPNFLFLTQDGSGNGPFSPSYVVAYGSRMCYGVGPTLYISNPSNPQQVTGDQNYVILPNQRPIGYAFPLPGNNPLFLTGDRWTAQVTDNSDVPATWAEPIIVSDSKGAASPNLVCWRTIGGYAWVVCEDGPYQFTGTYSEKPLSYLVADQWARVNWNAAYAIQINDDVKNLKLYVGVPLDGATECNAQFVFDYQNGITFDEIDISLDVYTPSLFSAAAVVKEYATSQSNLWIGPSTAGSVARFDSTATEDQGAAINSFWESGLVVGSGDFATAMVRVGGFDVWVRGTGTPIVTVYNTDHTQVITPPLLLNPETIATTLVEDPGQEYLVFCDLSAIYNYSFQFGTNSVGASWELSSFTGYAMRDLFNR